MIGPRKTAPTSNHSEEMPSRVGAVIDFRGKESERERGGKGGRERERGGEREIERERGRE